MPIVVLLIVSVLAIGFVIKKNLKWQSPEVSEQFIDPYASLKSYQNSTYGFTIKYPKNWFIKKYQDYAVDFYSQDPKEATPGAIKVRFSALSEKADINEFEKIEKLEANHEIREPLDVKSIITKIKNLEIAANPAVEFEINRNFSALEGPRTEYSHVYEIKKGEAILKFISSDETKDKQQGVDRIFERMMSSIKF